MIVCAHGTPPRPSCSGHKFQIIDNVTRGYRQRRIEQFRGQTRARQTRYRRTHPDKVKERKAAWRKSEKGKATRAKNQRDSNYYGPFITIDSEGFYTGKEIKTDKGTYSGSYDVSQILAGQPFKKGWEIARRKPLTERENPTGLCEQNRAVYWKGYAIQYLKRNHFTIGILEDPEHPRRYYINSKGEEKSGIVYKKNSRIVIDDMIGFYQWSLVKVVESLVKSAHATQKELVALKREKGNRQLCQACA
jgi:hypothetical protein